MLDALAGVYFDPELRTAVRRALVAVGMELIGGRVPEDPVQLAAGVCWAVGRANAALAPAGRVTQKALCAQLGLASFPSAKGRTVVAAEERAAARDKARMPEQLIDEAEVL